jgi:hypothetical protein
VVFCGFRIFVFFGLCARFFGLFGFLVFFGDLLDFGDFRVFSSPRLPRLSQAPQAFPGLGSLGRLLKPAMIVAFFFRAFRGFCVFFLKQPASQPSS